MDEYDIEMFSPIEFNKNRSCIEIIFLVYFYVLLGRLIKTEVVLKSKMVKLSPVLFEFNKNRSCIEIIFIHQFILLNTKFNKNRSCIEISKF